MITYNDLKKKWSAEFEDSGFENIDFELNELLGLAIGTDCRSADYAEKLKSTADSKTVQAFEQLCKRRLDGEPLQYILGEWEFYGLPFKVGKGVLIPRQDTETIVDIALQKLHGRSDITVIDLCAGSGCIGIALEKNFDCREVMSIEKSPQAHEYLVQNIELNGSFAKAVLGDIFDEQVIENAPMADIIVCNPPYVTEAEMKQLQREVQFEPESALHGGEDGLDYYRDIVRLWKHKLNEDGMMLFEIGKGQEDEVMQMMIQHGFKDVRTRSDLCGVNRCVFGFNRISTKLCTDVMSV